MILFMIQHSSCKGIAILRRGQPGKITVSSGEVMIIGESQLSGDFCDRFVRVCKHEIGGIHFAAQDELL